MNKRHYIFKISNEIPVKNPLKIPSVVIKLQMERTEICLFRVCIDLFSILCYNKQNISEEVMVKLIKATIHKYKSIETEQFFNVENDVTVLVGMNESGKTSILEALAKVNYFEDDNKFKFNMTHDFPRKQKKAVEKKGENPIAVTLTYLLSDDIIKAIETDVGIKLDSHEITYTKKYDGKGEFCTIPIDIKEFLKFKLNELNINAEKYLDNFSTVKNTDEFNKVIEKARTNGETPECLKLMQSLGKYFLNSWKMDNPIEEYLYREHLNNNLPKFMYYDDYYNLPSRVPIEDLLKGNCNKDSEKTAKALLELADIDIEKLIKANDFEDYKAELEATQLIISDELFKYWSTNQNLKINFDIDKVEKTDTQNNKRIVEHILDIRVQNARSGVSLPLQNRSKGFNWFFSFLVWFKKIQEDKKNTYILLLDEPGLNLHAMAQHDLLKFIYDLSKEYQIIYTTHSPFMIDSENLSKVRTVVEKADGTKISDSLQEKDPNTLFPLQAALGYTLAQNLFISPKNLLVEGIADLTYLNLISNILHDKGKEGLNGDITIVPVGGADKIATFVSLLRGNEIDMVCLLDTFSEQSAKQRLDKLVTENIIKEKKILFFNEFTGENFADFEDMFTDEEYISLYNNAFNANFEIADIKPDQPIMKQLKILNGGKDFNHYKPANYMAKNIASITLSDETLTRFEKMFKKINSLLC